MMGFVSSEGTVLKVLPRLWFVSTGRRELLSYPEEPPNTLGDLYLALGRRSVRENMFFESLMVFSMISFSPSIFGMLIL